MALSTKLDASTPLTWGNAAFDAETISLASTDYTPAVTARYLWVGGVGDVKLTTAGGGVVTLTAVPAGTFLPIAFSKVWKIGTSATLLVALA